MQLKRFTILIILSLTLPLRAEIRITRTETIIERKSFDPKNPPADMPKLVGAEAAVTRTYFGADTRVGGDVIDTQPSGNEKRAVVKVDTVRMTLSLRVTIWLPEKYTPKIEKHEEGHKQLAEHYYRDAEQIARKEAEALIGQTVSGTGENTTAASSNATKQAALALGGRYLGKTDVPCFEAQKYFDQITQHGTNAVAEARAIEQALTQVEAAEKDKK